MSNRYVECSSCGAFLPLPKPAGPRELPGEMDGYADQAQREHDPVCPTLSVTWEDLAEQQEMLAKAWTKRASGEMAPRLQLAMLDDAADAAGQAKSFRDASANGAPLIKGLAFFLRVVP